MKDMVLTLAEAERARHIGTRRWLENEASANTRTDYENRAIALAQLWKVAVWFEKCEQWLLDAEVIREMKEVATKTEVEKPAAHEGPEGPSQS